jgi:hypothetical protein
MSSARIDSLSRRHSCLRFNIKAGSAFCEVGRHGPMSATRTKAINFRTQKMLESGEYTVRFSKKESATFPLALISGKQAKVRSLIIRE